VIMVRAAAAAVHGHEPSPRPLVFAVVAAATAGRACEPPRLGASVTQDRRKVKKVP
jgi:hypothetical protein